MRHRAKGRQLSRTSNHRRALLNNMATSLFQVWLNPPAQDPMQQKMMWIMPVAFGVMFFVFPAGLVLYWLTNNILSIAQQWMINRQLGVN